MIYVSLEQNTQDNICMHTSTGKLSISYGNLVWIGVGEIYGHTGNGDIYAFERICIVLVNVNHHWGGGCIQEPLVGRKQTVFAFSRFIVLL